MNIKIEKRMLQFMSEAFPKYAVFNKWVGQTDGLSEYDNIRISLSEIDESILEKLITVISGDIEVQSGFSVFGREKNELKKKIESYLKVMKKGGKDARTSNLKEMETIMRAYFADTPNKWVFSSLKDKEMVPYLVTDIRYQPPRERAPAYLHFAAKAISPVHDEINIYFHAYDLKGGVSTVDLLTENEILPETEELVEEHHSHISRMKALVSSMGEQYSASGFGFYKKGHNWWHSITTLRSMVKDGYKSKIVIDPPDEEEAANKSEKTKEIGYLWTNLDDEEKPTVPIHPYVRIFHLEDHDNIHLHVRNIHDYEWNPEIVKKLVMSDDHKGVIMAVVESATARMEDIVSGKTGGVVVILSGKPGTGKTLTPEVVSEVSKRPLYRVQCSQLGVSVDDIESNLNEILARAQRWNAQLLIDEADVYLRQRGSDIEQNAIVGVFLRVLEYYRGLIFLTTNLSDDIDDAILSRAIAHIRYQYPQNEEKRLLWGVLSKQYGVKLSSSNIDELVNEVGLEKITGRNIKNLIRLGHAFAAHDKKPVSVDHIFKAIPFVDINP